MANREELITRVTATLNPVGDWHVCIYLSNGSSCNGMDRNLNEAIKNAFNCVARTVLQ